MAGNPQDSLERLAGCLAKLPGVGRRSAERMAIRLARDPEHLLKETLLALEDARRTLRSCSRCGSLTIVEEEPCRLCVGLGRDATVLCVVEDPSDIGSIEKSGAFRGRYHALMGKISPMRGSGPGELRIRSLLDRVAKEKFREVILALSTDVEGDSTASFIRELLKDQHVKVTRLAFGLPADSGVMYSDSVTLAKAIAGRQGF